MKNNQLVTCTKCGWVSYQITKAQAKAAVAAFNSWFKKQTNEVKELYGGKGSSLKLYLCGCGSRRFRPYDAIKDADVYGKTISPVIYEPKSK